MKNRNASWDAERFSSLDENRRAAIVKEEALQQERNAASKSIGEMMREGKKDEAETAKERVRAINEELDEISRQARAVNDALKDIFSKIDVQLVDFKIEEGKTGDGRILLADEITPDTCRLWDLKDGSGQIEHLDKDLFRRDLGNIIPAYEEIYDRLVKLAEAEGVERAE